MSELKRGLSEARSRQKQIVIQKPNVAFKEVILKEKQQTFTLSPSIFFFFLFFLYCRLVSQWINLRDKINFNPKKGVTRKFEFCPLVFQNSLGTRRRRRKKKHPQVLQIPFTVLKTPPPTPLSRLSSCTVFTSSAVAGLLRRRREGPMRMSAQFIKIPIVSSQRAPQRGAQHGLICSDSTPPNHFSLQTMARMWPHIATAHAVPVHCPVSWPSHTVLHHSSLPKMSVQTGTINKCYNMTPQEARYRPVL